MQKWNLILEIAVYDHSARLNQPVMIGSDHKWLVNQSKINSEWCTSDIEVVPTMDFLENCNGIYSRRNIYFFYRLFSVFFRRKKFFFEKVIIKIDRVINVDVPRYRVFCLTPKNEEDTFDSLIHFFSEKNGSSPANAFDL